MRAEGGYGHNVVLNESPMSKSYSRFRMAQIQYHTNGCDCGSSCSYPAHELPTYQDLGSCAPGVFLVQPRQKP